MAGRQGVAARLRELREAVEERATTSSGGYKKEPISDERWEAIERYALGSAAEQMAEEVAGDPSRVPERPETAASPDAPGWTPEHTRWAFWAGAIERGWIDPASRRYIGPSRESLAREAM